MVGALCSACAMAGYFSSELEGMAREVARDGISTETERRWGAGVHLVSTHDESSDSEPAERREIWARAKIEREPEI